jgi:hypothetical protein
LSAGKSGGATAIAHLRIVLERFGASISSQQILIPFCGKIFSSSDEGIDTTIYARLSEYLKPVSIKNEFILQGPNLI